MMIKSIKSFTGDSLTKQSDFFEWLNEHVKGQGIITDVNLDEENRKMYLYIGDALAMETGDAGYGLRLYALKTSSNVLSMSNSAAASGRLTNLKTAFVTDNGFGFVLWDGSASATNLTFQAGVFVIVSAFKDGTPFILVKSSSFLYIIDFNYASAINTAMCTPSSFNSTDNLGTSNSYNVAFMPATSMLRAMTSDTVMLHPVTWRTNSTAVSVITDSAGSEWVNLFGLASLKA